MTWTTHELAPPFPNFRTTPAGGFSTHAHKAEKHEGASVNTDWILQLSGSVAGTLSLGLLVPRKCGKCYSSNVGKSKPLCCLGAGGFQVRNPVPLKIRHALHAKSYVGGQTSFSWCGAEILRGCQLRCRTRHLTATQNDKVHPKIALVLV
ncbi:hypothetical protein AVEN_136503-1 [Araneus ventricosus]|uniref:Uncharacterized protein n=1 Tax=Araneus ventricosus TaxID=182803 RepID=A0A4Y2IQ39_ARAVE|nr:hypothetical protein AVEN_136503-1 [Araneus ventricosus]